MTTKHAINDRSFACSISKIAAFVLILTSLSLIALNERLLEMLESSLGMHMIFEHALFFLIGIVSIQVFEAILKFLHSNYQHKVYAKKVATVWIFILKAFYSRVNGWLLIAFALGLMAFWHLPTYFDLASSNESIHIMQHFSFVMVGSAVFLATRVFGDSFRVILLIMVIGMMGFSGLLFSVIDNPLYITYSLEDHQAAGMYMAMTSITILFIALPAFLIYKSAVYARSLNSRTK